MTQHVYLIPGFFGFTSLGSLNYFLGVAELLEERLAAHGVQAIIHEAETNPTGSIRTRALKLLGYIKETGGLEADGIHLIGHSTGGLDARLIATPGVQLDPSDIEQKIGDRLHTVQTLSTPHYGTPLANFFTTLQGKNLLYLLTLAATSGPGRHAVVMAAQALATVARIDNLLGQTDTMLDLLSKRLLDDVSSERTHKIWGFLNDISRDQGAIIQLTPESIDLFNAACDNRPDARYVCHVSCGPTPFTGLRFRELRSLYGPLARVLYAIAYNITAREHRSYPYPAPRADANAEVDRRLAFAVTPRSNDAIVPALSQIWGELGQVVLADHLDVVGQFARTYQGEKLPGWLKSGSGFNDTDMFNLWDAIARVIASAS